ncbi:hypothetical protein GYMLUDRAFT_48441 [Collybiopsis luxurians FD-317 M1]|uniref:Uncharacterized protein n=1 Tax=Collybiopsis luxurians FD-317 M1 TaxID=944289 RepID=A0A0D0AVY0_9AGAR|nr:hypothetical protein GYMLUDRAFT_48441 [Collybiopsis luxurians FD-317 M1]
MRQSSCGSSNDNAYGADDSSVFHHSHGGPSSLPIQGINQISVSAPVSVFPAKRRKLQSMVFPPLLHIWELSESSA